ncbi:MAG: pyridoxal phosphate-dependent aminotransferase [Gemmatimonadales bacterium]|nr:pyridoxal phosphate-dependent aminotransferase [Gemmatimonadales bacterium]
MPNPASRVPDFGDPSLLTGGLSTMARELRGSEILRIAAEVRAMIASGRQVCNLTVGDFDPRHFPVPTPLKALIAKALESGETNYPPSDGMLSLRRAVTSYVEREHGVASPVESVLITAGGRPAIYGLFRCLVNPGDSVVYGVPSWNNDYYTAMLGARGIPVATEAAEGFQPTAALLQPHLAEASLLCLCSPGNPTGTTLPREALKAILEAVVAENRRRLSAGGRPLFVLYDLMYGSLVFGGAAHPHPVTLVPASAPWVITVDGISKAFAATGLRVGWAIGAPAVISRLKDFLGHVGAWAPRPEQIATAEFLMDPQAISAFRCEMHRALEARLTALFDGFTALRQSGHPVDCVRPQGAMYLSLQLDLVGKRVDGQVVANNEEIRSLLLSRAGLAVVPFQAFGFAGESGWFRLSAGAVSLEDIAAAWPRLTAMLQAVA